MWIGISTTPNQRKKICRPPHHICRWLKDDEDLKTEIKNISDSCEICNIYRKPASRPFVRLLVATEFNEIVAMDIKEFNDKLIFHLIDHATIFSVATFVSSEV